LFEKGQQSYRYGGEDAQGLCLSPWSVKHVANFVGAQGLEVQVAILGSSSLRDQRHEKGKPTQVVF